MLSRMFWRFKSVSIVHSYNEKGEKIEEIAKIETENLFSWPLFVVGMVAGLTIIGHM